MGQKLTSLKWVRPSDLGWVGSDSRPTPKRNYYLPSPWLIEINASPAIGASTSVTARMVPAMIKDLLGVTTSPGALSGSGPMAVGTLECVYSQAEEDEERERERRAAMEAEKANRWERLNCFNGTSKA